MSNISILVTGAAGMIGSYLVSALADAGHNVIGFDRRCGNDKRVTYVVADLGDISAIKDTLHKHRVDRVIHLAALAHAGGEDDLSYSRFHHINVECAVNVFKAAAGIPVLFISTVDVFGFTKEAVSTQSPVAPLSDYAKTKALAEEECKRICKRFDIFRLSPVYTESVKRDIQKRYYLRYPKLGYRIGKGTDYEVLDVKNAVSAMVSWCKRETACETRIIKDDRVMNTAEVIRAEKAAGRANTVLCFPRWLVKCGYWVLRTLTGKNKYTYLLHKAVYPLKTE